MDWSTYYPAFAKKPVDENEKAAADGSAVTPLTKDVDVADIGCGFGGLLIALAPLMPDNLLLGMTIFEYVEIYLTSTRNGNSNTGHRIRTRTNQSFESKERGNRPIPKCILCARQYHEIPTQLLQEAPALQDLPLLP